MKVKCIKTNNRHGITLGKVYSVKNIFVEVELLYIVNDYGNGLYYDFDLFEIVEPLKLGGQK